MCGIGAIFHRDARPVDLPYFAPRAFDDALETLHFRFEAPLEAPPDGLYAVYLPKYSDNLDLFVNGALVRANTLPLRKWNTPLLVPVPARLLQDGSNRVALTLDGPKAEAPDLRAGFGVPFSRVDAFAQRGIGADLAKATGRVGISSRWSLISTRRPDICGAWSSCFST